MDETQDSKYDKNIKDEMGGLKFPLRIDLRTNNPEKEATERLLESVEFKPRSK
jgi:hypothetical protein